MKKRNKQLVIGLGAVSVLGAGLALASVSNPGATLYGPPPSDMISTENPAAEDTAPEGPSAEDVSAEDSSAEATAAEITEAGDTGSTAAEAVEEFFDRIDRDDIDFSEGEVPALMYGPPSYFGLDPEEEESE